MKRALALVPMLLALVGCAAQEPAASDPLETCIDVTVEYGLAQDRADASEFCTWLKSGEHVALFNGVGDTFDETFGDADSAREWASVEAAKD